MTDSIFIACLSRRITEGRHKLFHRGSTEQNRQTNYRLRCSTVSGLIRFDTPPVRICPSGAQLGACAQLLVAAFCPSVPRPGPSIWATGCVIKQMEFTFFFFFAGTGPLIGIVVAFMIRCVILKPCRWKSLPSCGSGSDHMAQGHFFLHSDTWPLSAPPSPPTSLPASLSPPLLC